MIMKFKNTKAILLFLLTSLLVFSDYVKGAESPKICLTMIVKNEEKIIERCLDSVKPLIDCISICDTGSTDHTVEIIQKYMKANKIPGQVHYQQWKNFGINRTLSCEAAQKTLRDLGFSLENTFLLLLDADMIFEIGANFNKNELVHDSYLLNQKNICQSYYNIRLIRASLPWECVGVTHEYWRCKKPATQSTLKTLNIDDRDDGGCKSDKFERDVKLLTQGLQEEPENERYMFYLAMSYRGIGQIEDSIKWYQARIKKGGWNEEVWYSKLMIGECYEELGKWNEALENYLDAYQYLPERSEPLHQISKYYRSKGQNHLSYLFASLGLRIPFPHHHVLFISHPVYDYLLEEAVSISAFYTPFKEEGYAATNRLMLRKNIPSYIQDQAYRNILFYVQNLKNIELKPIKIDLPLIREELSARYNPMNPTIRKTDSGYEVICRTVNYVQIGAKHFKSLDVLDSTYSAKTRNFLVQYDRDFKLLSQQEITENLPRTRKKILPIEGLEDCRIFTFKNSTWFTCTTLDTNPYGQPQISLCKLEDDRSGETVQVEALIPLFGPDPKKCEKNWLPFVKNDELNLVYSSGPFTIYKPEIDLKNEKLQKQMILRKGNTKYDFSRFSGSASPIEFDNGYLMLIHETVYENSHRNYMHRLVYFDQNYNFKKLSKPFTFVHKGIEYCCGMTIDHSEKKLVMSIGIEDREAYLCLIDLETIRSMLEPVQNL
jgi:glycosyltransferase involved in cell wall biosynthesis